MPEPLIQSDGTLELARLGDGPAARLLFAGDVCPINRLDAALAGGQVEAVFADTLELFQSADLAVINLESPLCTVAEPIAKCGPNFRAEPRVAAALAAAGVDVACLANNHVLDQGPTGLAQTRQALAAAGVDALGAGDSAIEAHRPLDVDLEGLPLTLVNFAEAEFAHNPQGPTAAVIDPVANCNAVAAAASAGRIVVAIIHHGNENVLFPSPRMRKRAHELIDAGAAAVVAHHPHVVQGVELYRGRPIAHSLGNFLFDWPEPEPECESAFLLEMTLTPAGVGRLGFVPVRKSDGGGAERIAGADRKRYLDLLNELSAPLSDPARLDRLWVQQCVRLYYERYMPKLRRFVMLSRPTAPDREDVLRLGYNLFNCPAHSEAMHTILQLLADEQLEDLQPEAEQLNDLMARLVAFARKSQPVAPRK